MPAKAKIVKKFDLSAAIADIATRVSETMDATDTARCGGLTADDLNSLRFAAEDWEESGMLGEPGALRRLYHARLVEAKVRALLVANGVAV